MIHTYGEILIDLLEQNNFEFKAQAGGAPANVAVMASLLGSKTKMISSLGKDFFGDFLVETLNEFKVDTKDVLRINKNTMLSFVKLDEGERTFSFYRNNTADNYLPNIDQLDFSNKIFHFGSVCLNNKRNIDNHLTMIEKYKNSNSLISFDPNLRFNLFNNKAKLRRVVNQFLKYTDILKISEEELIFITNTKKENEGINKLINEGINYIFLTRGSNGASLYTKDFRIHHQGYQVETIDTTGAGDAFVGVILHYININENKIKQKDWYEIIDKACLIAAETTKYNGAMDSYKKAINKI